MQIYTAFFEKNIHFSKREATGSISTFWHQLMPVFLSLCFYCGEFFDLLSNLAPD
jgi:hypothetical protein